jgi:hypothetical protein
MRENLVVSYEHYVQRHRTVVAFITGTDGEILLASYFFTGPRL